MKTKERVQRVGERGQITLPATWRKKINSNIVIVREKNGVLEITPLQTEDERDEAWIDVFDAVRDNKGKGAPIDAFIKKLETIVKK